MHKLFGRILMLPMLLVAALSLSTQAFAADTWQPQPGSQSVYVDPLLSSGPAAVNVSGLEQELQQAGRKHGLRFIFVIAERGSENIDNSVFGRQMTDGVLRRFQGSNGFNSDNYVLVTVYGLPGSNLTKTARSGNLGPRAVSLGVSNAALQSYMDNNKHLLGNGDVRGYFRNIANSINASIDRKIADDAARAQQAERDRIAEQERQRAQAEADRIAAEQAAARNEAILTGVTYGGPPLVIIVTLITLFVISRRRRATAEALLKAARTDANTLGQNYTDLQDKGLRFLDQTMGWEGRLKNRSLASVRQAMTLYSQITEGKLELSARLDKAEADFAGQKNPFGWGGYNAVIKAYTVDKITVQGARLSDEQRSLFGTAVVVKTYDKISDLMAEMETINTQLQALLKNLKQSFEKVRENKADIERLMGEVEALKPQLNQNELAFDPYQEGYDELIKARDAFLAIMDSDPLEASDDSQAVEDGVTAVKAALNRAIALKQSLATTAGQIEAAVKKVADTRGKAADYTYPEASFKAPEGLPVKLLLAEADGNPDKQIADARDLLAKAQELVLAGKLDEADKAKASSEGKVKEASNLVDAIVAAAAFIQKGVPGIRTALSKLKTEIDGGDAAVAELNAGFLKKNFEGQPGKLVTAKTVRDKTDGELAKIKTAFLEQRYLAGRALLEGIGSDIQHSRDGITEVHAKLAELKRLRDHAKTTVEAAADLAGALVRKLKDHAFTTSAKTDGTFANAQPVLTRQQTDVALDITDWPAAAKAADELLATLKSVDSKIDEEKRAYDNAVKAIGELETAVNTAANECRHDYVRQATTSKLGEGRTALSNARRDVAVAKADWNAIAARTEAGKDLCKKARELSAADKKAGTEAKAAIEQAQQKIDGVKRASFKKSKTIGGSSKTFGENVRANTSSAAALLTAAESLFNNQDYEKAKSKAGEAYNSAEKAEETAAQEVATAIGVAVAYQKQLDDAAAERQRQADAAAEASRRSNDSFNSSSSTTISSGFDNSSSTTTSNNGFD